MHAESTGSRNHDRTTQITDALAKPTQFSYDPLSNLLKLTFADGSSVVNTYDKANRLPQITDTLSGTITRGYDGLNRLTSETTPQGSVS